MRHEISVEFKGDYIFARHTGATSQAITREFLRRIAEACEEHRCYNILGESELSSDMSVLDAFAHAKAWPGAGLSVKHRVAWVNHRPDMRGTFEFIENVLKNRCMAHGHIFKTVAEAKRWLLSRTL
jgi:hypothetical protein